MHSMGAAYPVLLPGDVSFILHFLVIVRLQLIWKYMKAAY